MKLAHGIYHSRRRHQIRAVWRGQPFAKADERDVLKHDGSQSEGEFRHYLGSLLVSFGVPVDIVLPFICSKIKNLSPGVCRFEI